MCYAFACLIVDADYSAAVLITLKGLLVKFCIKITGIRLAAEELCRLIQDGYSGIAVCGAVIAVNHGNRASRRSGDHVDLRINFIKRLVQHNH